VKIFPAQVTTGSAPAQVRVETREPGHSGGRSVAEIFATEPVGRPGARPPGPTAPPRERRPDTVEILLPEEAGDAPFIEGGPGDRKRPAALTTPPRGTPAGAYVATADLLQGPMARGSILNIAA